jgi:hypothetical protein
VVLGLLVLAVTGRADESAAVKAVEKLGGRVTVDGKRPGKPVVAVDFSNTNVTELVLAGPQITDVGLRELKELKSLQKLHVAQTKVTDAGIQELSAALPQLQISR